VLNAHPCQPLPLLTPLRLRHLRTVVSDSTKPTTCLLGAKAAHVRNAVWRRHTLTAGGRTSRYHRRTLWTPRRWGVTYILPLLMTNRTVFYSTTQNDVCACKSWTSRHHRRLPPIVTLSIPWQFYFDACTLPCSDVLLHGRWMLPPVTDEHSRRIMPPPLRTSFTDATLSACLAFDVGPQRRLAPNINDADITSPSVGALVHWFAADVNKPLWFDIVFGCIPFSIHREQPANTTLPSNSIRFIR